MFIFTKLEEYDIIGRGLMLIVECPMDIDKSKDRFPFIGEIVRIDNSLYLVRGVESYALPLIKQGSKIGLLVTQYREDYMEKDGLLADMKKKSSPSRQNVLTEALTEYRESLGMDRDEFSGYLGLDESFVEGMEDGTHHIPRWMIVLLECKGFYE